jgi:small redox-active disulfide protein 2
MHLMKGALRASWHVQSRCAWRDRCGIELKSMKIKLQVLGQVCGKFNHLAASAEASARRLGLDYELERVTEFSRFADYGVVVTPALVVNGNLKVAGRVPKEVEFDMLLAPRNV